ncbi:MAG TPA: isocitrate lyase/phosphoenolpyruvate mutase family protein [Steroidobacteraceae bacterium]|nr:isocitrate lyase/phosphoenolpyruvate mutase family protein [Steroidobacteraceae bacterium]
MTASASTASPAAATQAEKADRFRALHTAPGIFVIGNAWDGGSAKVLTGVGYAALATSSAASAWTLGRQDGGVTREEALSQARIITAATPLPVSGDLEKGFGDSPRIVAETVRLAAEAGLVGCSIEDATGEVAQPVFGLTQATERIAAAAEAARSLAFPFTLTARAENFLRGREDLDDTLRRLQAYERAGADVLFAPGLRDLAAVRTVCAAVSRPVNFMAGIPGRSFSVAELAAAGVKRVSLATSLYRAAMSGLIDAAREVREHGTFGYIERGVNSQEVSAFLR